MGKIMLSAGISKWKLRTPFHITGHVFRCIEVVDVALELYGVVGCGEAIEIYYRGDSATSILNEVEVMRPHLDSDLTRHDLPAYMPPGSARNALDCAFWDLEAKLNGMPVTQLMGLDDPKPIVTTFTCGADSPEQMAKVARSYSHAQAIKLKLTGELIDHERVQAVRHARPDVWLSVDANQGFSPEFLEGIIPTMLTNNVSLVEQPFPIGSDNLLDDFKCPIPIAADESFQTIDDLPALIGRYDAVNIKLDKCGGLTAGLEIAHEAKRLGLDIMVGNMMGTSRAMAPAFVLGQLCSMTDLDGPIFLEEDRANPALYESGTVYCSRKLWG